jgi:hypothetical protein
VLRIQLRRSWRTSRSRLAWSCASNKRSQCEDVVGCSHGKASNTFALRSIIPPGRSSLPTSRCASDSITRLPRASYARPCATLLLLPLLKSNELLERKWRCSLSKRCWFMRKVSNSTLFGRNGQLFLIQVRRSSSSQIHLPTSLKRKICIPKRKTSCSDMQRTRLTHLEQLYFGYVYFI